MLIVVDLGGLFCVCLEWGKNGLNWRRNSPKRPGGGGGEVAGVDSRKFITK